MLIVFSGLPGTGKSALARETGRATRIPVFSVDPIEDAILRTGIPQSFETGLAAYLVAETLVDAQLALGHGAIVDAVNAVAAAKETWRTLAARHRVALKIVECRCSDEALHRARLEARRRGLQQLAEPSWADVQQRRLEYTPWAEPVLSVDTVAGLESNVKRALAWLDDAA